MERARPKRGQLKQNLRTQFMTNGVKNGFKIDNFVINQYGCQKVNDKLNT